MAAVPTELTVANNLDDANRLLGANQGWVLANIYTHNYSPVFVLSRELPEPLLTITASQEPSSDFPQQGLSDLAAAAKARGATSMFFLPHPLGMEVWFNIGGGPVRHGRLDPDSQAAINFHLREVTSTEAVDTIYTAQITLRPAGVDVVAELRSAQPPVYSVELHQAG